MIETQILKGNLIKQEHSLAFTLNQYDKNISYKINLIGVNGNSYTLDNEDIVTIEWLKPNSRPFLQSSNITKGDTYITILIPEAVTQFPGEGSYNIIITNGGARKGTIKREYNVIGNSMRSGTSSEDVITDAITELRSLNTELAEKVQNNQEIINNNSAATKQDIANVNSSLEEKAKQINNLILDVINPPTSLLQPCKIDGTTDDYTALKNIIKFAEDNKYSCILFPKTGYDMILSEGISIKFSNITLDIRCNIKSTKTEKHNVITIMGSSVTNKIKNVKILGNGSTIDGNGLNIIGYTYDTSDNLYCCVYAWGVENLYIENLHATNGLCYGMLFSCCPNGLINNCTASYSVHDNGFQIANNPLGLNFEEDDPTQFNNFIFKNCSAYNNTDFGFTSWQAAYVTFENCNSYNNGNYGTSYGYGGGYSAENGSLTPRQDAHVKFINCVAKNNVGYGIYTDMDGVYIDEKCDISGTKIAVTDNPIGRFGNGVTILTSRKNISVYGSIYDNENNGILYLSEGGDTNSIQSLNINCNSYGNGANGLYIQGIESGNIQGKFKGNTLKGVYVDNLSNYNYQLGSIIIDVTTETNKTYGTFIRGVGTVIMNSVYSNNDCITSGEYGIFADKCLDLEIKSAKAYKSDSTTMTKGVYIGANTVKSKIFNINSNCGFLDLSSTRNGLTYNVNKLPDDADTSYIILKINTLIDRLRESRIINDGEV